MGCLPEISLLPSRHWLLRISKTPNYPAVPINLTDCGLTRRPGPVKNVPPLSEYADVLRYETQGCHCSDDKTIFVEFEGTDARIAGISNVENPLGIKIRASNRP